MIPAILPAQQAAPVRAGVVTGVEMNAKIEHLKLIHDVARRDRKAQAYLLDSAERREIAARRWFSVGVYVAIGLWGASLVLTLIALGYVIAETVQ